MPEFPRDKKSGSGDLNLDKKEMPAPYCFDGEAEDWEDNGPELTADLTENENRPDPETASENKKVVKPVVLSPRLMFWGGLGLAVLLIWVFALGILVGRGSIFQSKAFKLLEDRLARNSDLRVSPVIELGEESVDGPVTAASEKPELTFYESLTQSYPRPEKVAVGPRKPKSEEPAAKKPSPEKTLKPAPSETKATSSETSGPEVSSSTADETEAKDKPRVTTEAAAVNVENSAAPPRRPGENFTIQVAAADSLAAAERMAAALKARGLDAYYYQVALEGRQYFRVRVGRYETRDQAKAALAELEAKGFKNMFISALTD